MKDTQTSAKSTPQSKRRSTGFTDEERDARLQRPGEPRRRRHVAVSLRSDEVDRRRRGKDRRAREESGELRTELDTGRLSTDLRSQERLHSEPDDRDDQRKSQQSKAESDGELVDADGQPQIDNGNPARPREQLQPCFFFFLVSRSKHEQPGNAEECDRRPTCEIPNDVTNCAADQEAHNGHACLKCGEDQAGRPTTVGRNTGHSERGCQREGVKPERKNYPRQEEQVASHEDSNLQKAAPAQTRNICAPSAWRRSALACLRAAIISTRLHRCCRRPLPV